MSLGAGGGGVRAPLGPFWTIPSVLFSGVLISEVQ